MRVIIQRVKYASVTIDNIVKSNIKKGLLVLVGIENEDIDGDILWISKKICQLRIFNDAQNKMNFSVKDIGGEILVISQFTLFASTKKGNRPSYIKSAKPDVAIPIYEKFKIVLSETLGKPIGSGEFGADMQVELLNDGPVTICIDSKNKE